MTAQFVFFEEALVLRVTASRCGTSKCWLKNGPKPRKTKIDGKRNAIDRSIFKRKLKLKLKLKQKLKLKLKPKQKRK
jgi:hypothetical protein